MRYIIFEFWFLYAFVWKISQKYSTFFGFADMNVLIEEIVFFIGLFSYSKSPRNIQYYWSKKQSEISILSAFFNHKPVHTKGSSLKLPSGLGGIKCDLNKYLKALLVVTW